LKTAFFKDVVVISIAQGVAGLLAFFYTVITARYLGVENFGLFQALMATFGSLSLLNGPLNLFSVHCVGTSSDETYAQATGEFLKISLMASSVLCIGIILSSPWISSGLNAGTVVPVLVISGMLILRAVFTTFAGALQGRNRHLAFSVTRVVESFVCLASGTILLALGIGVTGALSGYVVGMFVLIVYFLKQKDLYVFKKGFRRIREELKEVCQIMAAFGVLLFMESAPVIVGRVRMSAEMSGYLGALYNMRQILLPFALAIAVPFYSRTLSKENEPKMLSQAIGLLSLLGGGFIFSGILFPDWIITIIYGKQFVGASPYFALFGWSMLLQMLSMVIMLDRIATKKMNYLFLLVPACIMTISLALPEIGIATLIYGQIAACSTYLALVVVATFIRRILRKAGEGS
jgi:O-antigen/teichoic acid export membrane protein